MSAALFDNKACNLEDFADPELRRHIQEIFGEESGNGGEKMCLHFWEEAVHAQTLQAHGAWGRDAVLLGVGTRAQNLVYYLTHHAARVVAVDYYLNPLAWNPRAPISMLWDPEITAPYPYEERRLEVRHMDCRKLNFQDATFDGLFCSRTLEHLESPEFVANAAFEMGRVLKPGGVLSLTLRTRISGPPGGTGTEDCLFIPAEEWKTRLEEASGLKLTSPADLHFSDRTLTWQRDSLRPQETSWDALIRTGQFLRKGESLTGPDGPLVTLTQGYLHGLVHLTFVKTAEFSATGWARPGGKTAQDIIAYQEAARPCFAAVEQAGTPVDRPQAFPEDLLPALHESVGLAAKLQTYNQPRSSFPGLLGYLHRIGLRLIRLKKTAQVSKLLLEKLKSITKQLD